MSIPCACPSLWSHPKCLARWQLQQAGRDEEIRCRFCSHALPTWAASFEEAEAKTAAPAVMAVVFNGKMVKLPITPGPDGVEIFKREVRRIFQLADDVSLDVTFELKVPTLVEDNSSKVYLKGFQAFDAASTVAQMAASKRAAYQPQQSDLDATTGPSSSSSPPRRAASSPVAAHCPSVLSANSPFVPYPFESPATSATSTAHADAHTHRPAHPASCSHSPPASPGTVDMQCGGGGPAVADTAGASCKGGCSLGAMIAALIRPRRA
ncbi:hypothetical protein FOA52_010815 [Chlamydomonas sp. UWO 241]|nr:hypothetical protein FOA52_010815 [Chlamydomonas sp. UWO 241]